MLSRLPHGWVLGLSSAILALTLLAGKTVWSKAVKAKQKGIPIKAAGSNMIDVEKVKDRIDNLAGGLDFYSCLALSLGRYMLGRGSLKFLPGLFCVLFMQILLEVLMLGWQLEGNHVRYYSEQGSYNFRFLGFMVFMFASFQIVGATDDECRDVLLLCMDGKRVSGWYKWPLLAGELVNKLIAMVLVLILFLIFCQSQRPTGLLLNCVAVQFVVGVDKVLVPQQDEAEALDNLDAALHAWNHSASGHSDGLADKAAFFVIGSIRIVSALLICFLALEFTFANNDALCQQMKEIDQWPFCLGITVH